MLVFSTIDKTSFDDMTKWRDGICAECKDMLMVLVQNKIDRIDEVLS